MQFCRCLPKSESFFVTKAAGIIWIAAGDLDSNQRVMELFI